MKLNEELKKLREQQARDIQELEYLQHDLQRLQNRLAYLEKGERQKRAHRLITKGAAIERLAPATKEIGEAEFFSLMEKIFALPDALALLPKEDTE